ncbi:MAG: LacI family DNA-binding transcriptional regulator [Mangrovibacterium sp.]
MDKRNSSKRTVVRIKDIAQKANVSTGTVDRVLHNRGRVSDEVSERVLRIAKEMNYEPNLLARALVSKKEYRIAAVIPDPLVDAYWEDPKKGIAKAETELRQYGVWVDQFLFSQYSVESFKEAAEKVSVSSYDGILIAPIFYKESLAYLSKWKRQNIPFNLFNTHIPDYEPLAYIGQDSYQSGFLAAKLLHYGHPTPATFFVAHVDEDVPNSSHLIRKEQGFIDYFEQHGNGQFRIAHADLKYSSEKEHFQTLITNLLNKNPDTRGIFVTNSKAFTLAEYLFENKFDNIHLVGYDLIKQNLAFLEKGTINFLINQNPKRQGYYGIQLLIDYLLFKKNIQPIKYLPLDIITQENLHYYIESEI